MSLAIILSEERVYAIFISIFATYLNFRLHRIAMEL